MKFKRTQVNNSFKEVEVDFGTVAVNEAKFTITDSQVKSTDKIIASVSGNASTGKDADEVEMDNFYLVCTPSNGSFTVFIACLTGAVAGTLKINYHF